MLHTSPQSPTFPATSPSLTLQLILQTKSKDKRGTFTPCIWPPTQVPPAHISSCEHFCPVLFLNIHVIFWCFFSHKRVSNTDISKAGAPVILYSSSSYVNVTACLKPSYTFLLHLLALGQFLRPGLCLLEGCLSCLQNPHLSLLQPTHHSCTTRNRNSTF